MKEGSSHLLRINDGWAFDSEISLQPQQHDRYIFSLSRIIPCRLFPPQHGCVRQALSIIDGVADHHKIRSEQGIVIRRRGVVKFETIRAIVHADVEDEGLVNVAKEGEVGVFCTGGVEAM